MDLSCNLWYGFVEIVPGCSFPIYTQKERKDGMDVAEILKQYGVSTKSWGQGQAKTVAHLQKEADEGESVLEEHEGSLVRFTTILNFDVFFRDGSVLYHLCEDRQEFVDGRTRHRTFLSCSVAEKVKAEEKVDNILVARALEEELGV